MSRQPRAAEVDDPARAGPAPPPGALCDGLERRPHPVGQCAARRSSDLRATLMIAPCCQPPERHPHTITRQRSASSGRSVTIIRAHRTKLILRHAG
ncbi:hypothetical protein Franean1_1948 [Parafrankia sp. EAN1pec]|nr:hypothetical protein Franean1_1948 [Frankia sp. EAN1pec]